MQTRVILAIVTTLGALVLMATHLSECLQSGCAAQVDGSNSMSITRIVSWSLLIFIALGANLPLVIARINAVAPARRRVGGSPATAVQGCGPIPRTLPDVHGVFFNSTMLNTGLYGSTFVLLDNTGTSTAM
ncbi:hypothetical protein BH09PSE6_BH09PSE6_03700 [soil metagenome]